MIAMRFLVACPECHRQFDATGRAEGSAFPCSCGAAVTVPRPRAHDAAVVRCSSCGAPREETAPDCRFCGAEFTLHERDLDTICPGCMARVSGQARFCHHCGTPVLAAQASAGESGYRCPACPGGHPLVSRRLGQASVAIFDCSTCGGLWVEREIFEVIADRARSGQLPEGFGGGAPATAAADTHPSGPQPLQPLHYRPCVICGALMNRRNYGRKSGVIVDLCARHGIWFDLHELDRLLRWIREGGEERTGKLQQEETRIEARQKALAEGPQPWESPEGESWLLSRSNRSGSVLGEVVSGVVDGVIHWFSR
jgi:Zn-finger nucleic acid-binding protein/ribosomal protein L40E